MEDLIPKLEQNLLDKFSFIPQLRQSMEVTSELGPIVISSKLRSDMFNIVISNGDETTDVISNVKKYFGQIPFAWWVGFKSDPENLTQWLEDAGFTKVEDELAMYSLLEGIPALETNDHLEIRAVHDEKHMQDFVNVLSNLLPDEKEAIYNFYVPSLDVIQDSPLTLFVGYQDETPIATASIFCEDYIAGLYDLTVLPEHRRKKIATRMTLGLMHYSAEVLRADACVLSATDDAQHVYNKIGFSNLKSMAVYRIKDR